jgi:acylphosphatase
MIARRLVVRGRVQGVGYRDAMVAAARACGVAGWVRNRADGTVEVLIQGDADAVARAIAWCRRGPPAARVTSIDIDEDPALEANGAFTVRPTLI